MAKTPSGARAWRPKLTLWFWLTTALVVVLTIAALASNGLSGLLVIWGVVAVCTALFVLLTGKAGWLAIPSRKIGIGVLVAGLVVSGAGGALAEPATPVSAVRGEQGPSTVPSETVTSTPTPTPTPTPKIETRDEVVTSDVPFAALNRDDAGLQVGTNAVTTPGANGTKATTFRVTIVDGVETGRVQVAEAITVAPVDQVTSVGTRPAPAPAPAPVAAAPSGCDPNYSGCVPVASDVDCAGGSGNGPAYAEEVVQVIGTDIYDLDRDDDGYGCD